MQLYLWPPWTDSCKIWCVRVFHHRVFHHVILKNGHENAEMQKQKFDDVTLQYSIYPFSLVPTQVWISVSEHCLFSFSFRDFVTSPSRPSGEIYPIWIWCYSTIGHVCSCPHLCLSTEQALMSLGKNKITRKSIDLLVGGGALKF